MNKHESNASPPIGIAGLLSRDATSSSDLHYLLLFLSIRFALCKSQSFLFAISPLLREDSGEALRLFSARHVGPSNPVFRYLSIVESLSALQLISDRQRRM